MKASNRIDIPSHARAWGLDECPISARMRNVLRKRGYSTLGDVHGRDFADLRKRRGCGRGSIENLKRFLRRLHSGEFHESAMTDPSDASARMVSVIDEFCRRLPSRDREVVLTRLGARRRIRTQATLAALGHKHGRTRERIRQVVNVRMAQLRCHGGPPFVRLLHAVAGRCLAAVCPLTPELLTQWLGRTRETCRYSPSFYVRVIGLLCPQCPAWADAKKRGVPTEREEQIATEVKKILEGRINASLAAEVLRQLNLKPGFAKVTAFDFLEALRVDGSVSLSLRRPDQLVVMPPVPVAAEAVKLVLSLSDRALSLDQIVDTARSYWGKKALAVSIQRLSRWLQPVDGIYLLGSGVYGLRKHIGLPETFWPQVKDDLMAHLEQEGWMISTFDVISQAKFDWTSQTNPFELAVILRDDSRFTETGNCLFALSIARALETATEPAISQDATA